MLVRCRGSEGHLISLINTGWDNRRGYIYTVEIKCEDDGKIHTFGYVPESDVQFIR